MRNDRNNVIVDKMLEFALGINEFTEILEEKKKLIFERQLLKSGTSIGANVWEAQSRYLSGAESKADFIHKLKISAKEVDETEYWLELCKRAKSYPYKEKIHTALIEINKILSKTISSAKRVN